MQSKVDHTHIKMLLIVFFLMLIGFFIYEWIKQWLHPDITVWESHAITIIIGSTMSATLFHFALRYYQRLQQQQQNLVDRMEESEKSYKSIFELLPDAAFLHRNGKILFANMAASNMLKYNDPSEMVGLNLLDLIHQDFRVIAQERVQLVEQEGRSAPLIEERLLQANGEIIDVEVASTSYSYQGNPAVLSVFRDVTEKNKTLHDLRESEQRYSSLFENNHSVMMLIDPETGIIQQANAAACAFYGYRLDEFKGKGISEINILTPEEIHREMEKAIAEKRKHFHFCHRLSSGEVRDVEVFSGPIVFNGKPFLYSIVHDITERKRFEAAQREAQQFNKDVLNCVGANVAVLNGDGVIAMVNEAWNKFALDNQALQLEIMGPGINYIEVCRQAQDDIYAQKALEGIRGVLQGALDRFVMEYPCPSPHAQRWFLMTVSPLQTSKGGAVISHIDISERKKVEEELRKLTRAVEQSPASVVVTDLSGKIEYANPKFTQVTGYSLEETLGQNPRLLKSGEIPPEGYRELWEVITSGGEWHGEFHNRKKNGELYWEYASISPIRDTHGVITHYLAVKEDITERKKAEAEFQQAKEAAEAANRAKSEFLANISHEIRTPMNGIIGMTELALATSLSPEQTEYLEMVKSSADSLLTLINDILDYSKIEAGKMELDETEFDLWQMVEKTTSMLAYRANEKALELVCRIDPFVPKVVSGDPDRIRQVLLNLLSNAVKFTDHGEIELSVSVEQTQDPEDYRRTVCFAVRDTGIGIPGDKMDRLFKSFSQVDGSTTRKYGGTGLGLAISKHLVELMGGTISVESREGMGSVFAFTVNINIPREMRDDWSQDVAVVLNGLTALVIDDNKTNRVILHDMLTRWGMNVVSARSGDQGLAKLQEYQEQNKMIDIILLDAHMPEMDGFAVAEVIKDNPHLVPSIMLTSSGISGDGTRCRELGISACLTKPVRQMDLADTMERVLRLNGYAKIDSDKGSVTEGSPEISGFKNKARILLAEDNKVNQTLVAILLHKMGWEVETAVNGQEALDIWQSQRLDLILMDLQMPEVDGLEATRRIREAEKSSGSHIPIVALTAHAMKGDRERCLEAGMDDYLPKPIQPQMLYGVVNRLLFEGDRSLLSSPEEFDPDVLLELVSGDRALAAELLNDLIQDVEEKVGILRQAIATGDHEALWKNAHSIKGAVGNFGLKHLYQCALTLERMGKEGIIQGAYDIITGIEKAIQEVGAAFKRKLY